MSLTEFLRRFLVQASLAAAASFLVLLGLERLMPGFVSPFINAPVVGMLVVALLVAAAIVARPSMSRLVRIFIGICIGACLLAGGTFLWTRINDLGGLGLLLILSALVLSALVSFVFLTYDPRGTN